MQKKIQPFSPSQVAADIVPTKMQDSLAVNITNLRLTNPDEKEGNSLVLSNERLPKDLEIAELKDKTILTVVECTLDSIAIFCIDSSNSYIYIYKDNTATLVYKQTGIIFDEDIKAIFQYETESLQKLYWIDSSHQPRIFNIKDTNAAKEIASGNNVTTPIDFVPEIPSFNEEPLNIEETPNGGLWTGGALKYLITFCVPYIVESNIACYSDLYFINKDGYGLNQDGSDKSYTTYKITLKQSAWEAAKAKGFTHCRIYRIYYTSQNQPTAYDLGYYNLPNLNTDLSILDTGNNNVNASPTDVTHIRFKGITPITDVKSFTVKDNHLLFGGYKTLDNTVEDTEYIQSHIEGAEPTVTTSLKNTSLADMTFFHKDEHYKFGVQFMNKQGVWSNVVSSIPLSMESNCKNITFNISGFPKDNIAARIVCSYPAASKRKFIAQGIQGNTIYYALNGTYAPDYIMSEYTKFRSAEVSYNINDTATISEETSEAYTTALVRTNKAKMFVSPDIDDHFNDIQFSFDTIALTQDCNLSVGDISYAIAMDINNPLLPVDDYITNSSSNDCIYKGNYVLPNLALTLPTYMGNTGNNIPTYSKKEDDNTIFYWSTYNLPLWAHEGSLNNASNVSSNTVNINLENGKVDSTGATINSDRQYKLAQKIISRKVTLNKDTDIEANSHIYTSKYINNAGLYNIDYYGTTNNETTIVSLQYHNNPQFIYNSNNATLKVFSNFTTSVNTSEALPRNDYFKYEEYTLNTIVTPAEDAPKSDPAYSSTIQGAMHISYKTANHLLLYDKGSEDEVSPLDTIPSNSENDDEKKPFIITVMALHDASSTGNVRCNKLDTNVASYDTLGDRETRGDVCVYPRNRDTDKKSASLMLYVYDSKAQADLGSITYLAPWPIRWAHPHDYKHSDNYRNDVFKVSNNERRSSPKIGFSNIDTYAYLSTTTVGDTAYIGVDSLLQASHPDFNPNKEYYCGFENVLNQIHGGKTIKEQSQDGRFAVNGYSIGWASPQSYKYKSLKAGWKGVAFGATTSAAVVTAWGGAAVIIGALIVGASATVVGVFVAAALAVITGLAIAIKNIFKEKHPGNNDGKNSNSYYHMCKSLTLHQNTSVAYDAITLDDNALADFKKWLSSPIPVMLGYKTNHHTSDSTSSLVKNEAQVRFLGLWTPLALMIESYIYDIQKDEEAEKGSTYPTGILARWWATKQSPIITSDEQDKSVTASDYIYSKGKKYFYFPKNQVYEVASTEQRIDPNNRQVPLGTTGATPTEYVMFPNEYIHLDENNYRTDEGYLLDSDVLVGNPKIITNKCTYTTDDLSIEYNLLDMTYTADEGKILDAFYKALYKTLVFYQDSNDVITSDDILNSIKIKGVNITDLLSNIVLKLKPKGETIAKECKLHAGAGMKTLLFSDIHKDNSVVDTSYGPRTIYKYFLDNEAAEDIPYFFFNPHWEASMFTPMVGDTILATDIVDKDTLKISQHYTFDTAATSQYISPYYKFNFTSSLVTLELLVNNNPNDKFGVNLTSYINDNPISGVFNLPYSSFSSIGTLPGEDTDKIYVAFTEDHTAYSAKEMIALYGENTPCTIRATFQMPFSTNSENKYYRNEVYTFRKGGDDTKASYNHLTWVCNQGNYYITPANQLYKETGGSYLYSTQDFSIVESSSILGTVPIEVSRKIVTVNRPTQSDGKKHFDGTVNAGNNTIKLVIANKNTSSSYMYNTAKLDKAYAVADDTDTPWYHSDFGYTDGVWTRDGEEQDVQVLVSQYYVNPETLTKNQTDKSKEDSKLKLVSLYQTIENPREDELPENLVWYPCSKVVYNGTNSLVAEIGDCYYQPYSAMLTNPYTEEETNQLVEIYDFNVFTHVNLLGRYDKRRNLIDNTQSRFENYNLHNPVYNQADNFFTANHLSTNDLINTEFPCQIVYSLNKVAGAKEDSWTLTNPATGFYDTNGALGPIISICNNRGTVYCFQEKGIGLVSFNARVQIPTSDGIPIEMSNSDKLDNIVDLTSQYGIQHYKQVSNAEEGIYFIDSYTHHLCTITQGNIVDVAKTKYNASWFKEDELYYVLYDSRNSDIYCVGDTKSLVYNTKLQSFVGEFNLYAKANTLGILRINTDILKYHNEGIQKLFASDSYASSYNISLACGTTDALLESIIFNSSDKDEYHIIATNRKLETNRTANSNSLVQTSNTTKPFDAMLITNDYQQATSTNDILTKRNRTWYWTLPRAFRKGKVSDRMHDNYQIFTLSKTDSSGKQIKFYDFALVYYN